MHTKFGKFLLLQPGGGAGPGGRPPRMVGKVTWWCTVPSPSPSNEAINSAQSPHPHRPIQTRKSSPKRKEQQQQTGRLFPLRLRIPRNPPQFSGPGQVSTECASIRLVDGVPNRGFKVGGVS